jgi:predicted heme/steroid binding protein
VETFTELQLRRYDGEQGRRALIAYRGLVYDVTDCPQWHNGSHKNLHYAGQDLTGELPEAPHAEEVFGRPCVRVIGRLLTSKTS